MICQFVIDIELITVKGLIAMRPVLPPQEYRLLKNRKCAREARRKRKIQSHYQSEELQACLQENANLLEYIKTLERRLKLAEQALVKKSTGRPVAAQMEPTRVTDQGEHERASGEARASSNDEHERASGEARASTEINRQDNAETSITICIEPSRRNNSSIGDGHAANKQPMVPKRDV